MMDERELIESGILEMYVFGKTSAEENEQINAMAARYPAVRDEILSIEQAVVSLTYSMAPNTSVGLYDRLREKAFPVSAPKKEKRGANWSAIFGWTLAIALLLGAGYLYSELDAANNRVASARTERAKMKEDLLKMSNKNTQSENLLTVIRDANNKVIYLTGKPVAPHANAKIYWNPDNRQVYVDATGLPEPPEGMEYQVWLMTKDPMISPRSIGLLKDFKGNMSKIFAVDNTSSAEAFGISLELAGGSRTPTPGQLYAVGQAL